MLTASAACTHVRPLDLEAPESRADLRERLDGEDVRIVAGGRASERVAAVDLRDDALRYEVGVREEVVAFGEVRSIRYRDTGRGVVDGLVLGTASGAFVGVLAALTVWGASQQSCDGGACFSLRLTPKLVALFAVPSALLGAGAGASLGAYDGAEVVYER